ncbi:MAG TPA: short-chain fatty acyl-CoA regulator family protein, partial [Afifellaceae bacterium]|nr:short-chain fatty acyl-CoA regulator family protein [Afifellaceae bacterium]
YIGPKLRQLRLAKGMTQVELSRLLGVSASYVNLIEKNQRSASLRFLVALSDSFGLDWRQLTDADSKLAIADLRQLTRDPAFGDVMPDIEEMRSALENAPNLVSGLFSIHRAYREVSERLAAQSDILSSSDEVEVRGEQIVHDFFRRSRNYFHQLEERAEGLRNFTNVGIDEFYPHLKAHLSDNLGIRTQIVPVDVLDDSLRFFDRHNKRILLSEGLDYTNKVFQLAHCVALIEHSDTLNSVIGDAGISDKRSVARCRVELANYFAAAMMMPYAAFLREAGSVRYDVERLAAKFAVSYEQVCHRLTTLQRPGAKGVPFFFLRIDRAGNVSKRFNATPIQLARYGGACPKLDVHYCFRTADRILPQTVEMPDGSRYLTINRTVDRPSLKYSSEDKRQAVSLGCSVEFAPQIVYSDNTTQLQSRSVTEVGVNCRLCPRRHCQQRAHEPVFQTLDLDEDRRGLTRFES